MQQIWRTEGGIYNYGQVNLFQHYSNLQIISFYGLGQVAYSSPYKVVGKNPYGCDLLIIVSLQEPDSFFFSVFSPLECKFRESRDCTYFFHCYISAVRTLDGMSLKLNILTLDLDF